MENLYLQEFIILALISIPLAKLHLIYNEELLHWLTLNKPLSPILRSGLHKEIIHLHKKLALFDFHIIFRSTQVITFLGGLKSHTISLYLTDIAHHHLAVGILFVWASHLYLSFYKGFGHRIGDVFVNLFANGPILVH